MSIHCPVCRREFEPTDSPTMPFCSERCRLIDLGRWLSEDYGMPVEPEDSEGEREGEDEEPMPPTSA
ncbi:MAG: DNA gyrase inhibitor YacG [Thermoguttaceae bacterium]